MDSGVKRCKVWNANRKVKKAIAAKSLKDMTRKGCEKLDLDGTVTVVLEEDGTIVDDEEYWLLLEQDTTFLLLQAGEKWTDPAAETEGDQDEVDFVTVHNCPDSMDPAHADPDTTLAQLANILRSDTAKIITFSPVHLQCIVDADTSELSPLLGQSKADTRTVQESCQRYLDEKVAADEAVQLVKLLTSVRPAEAGAGEGAKRPRLE